MACTHANSLSVSAGVPCWINDQHHNHHPTLTLTLTPGHVYVRVTVDDPPYSDGVYITNITVHSALKSAMKDELGMVDPDDWRVPTATDYSRFGSDNVVVAGTDTAVFVGVLKLKLSH